MRCAHANCGGLIQKPDIEPWPIHDHSQRFEPFLVNQVKPICYSPGKAGSVVDDRLLGGPAFPSLQRLNGQLINSIKALTALETGKDGNATLRSLAIAFGIIKMNSK